MSTKPTPLVLAKMEQLPVLPLSYSPANSDASATKLVYTLLPEWNPAKGGRGIKIVKFTDGITNTVRMQQVFSFFPRLLGVYVLLFSAAVAALHRDRLDAVQTCEKCFGIGIVIATLFRALFE